MMYSFDRLTNQMVAHGDVPMTMNVNGAPVQVSLASGVQLSAKIPGSFTAVQ